MLASSVVLVVELMAGTVVVMDGGRVVEEVVSFGLVPALCTPEALLFNKLP